MASIQIFAGNFAPRYWSFCYGQQISIAQNSALFSLLGTTYGGNGIQTFGLPDLRGRAPIGAGQGPGLQDYVLGQMSGTEATTILTSNLPPHVHAAAGVTVTTTIHSINGATARQPNPGNALPCNAFDAVAGNIVQAYAPASGGTASTMDPTMATNVVGGQTAVTGSGFPISNLSPYLAINYIICMQGIFPSRN